MGGAITAMDNMRYLAIRYYCMSDAERAVIREAFDDTVIADVEALISQFPRTDIQNREALSDLLRQELLGVRDARQDDLIAQKFWVDLLKRIKSRGVDCPQNLKQCLEQYIH